MLWGHLLPDPPPKGTSEVIQTRREGGAEMLGLGEQLGPHALTGNMLGYT